MHRGVTSSVSWCPNLSKTFANRLPFYISFAISQAFWHQGFLWTANEITLDPVSVGLGLAQDAMLVLSLQYCVTWIEDASDVLKWHGMATHAGQSTMTKMLEPEKWRANKSGSQTRCFHIENAFYSTDRRKIKTLASKIKAGCNCTPGFNNNAVKGKDWTELQHVLQMALAWCWIGPSQGSLDMSQDSKSSRRQREDKTNHALQLRNSGWMLAICSLRMGTWWAVHMPGMAAVGVELVWSCDGVPSRAWASAVPETAEKISISQSGMPS